MKRVGIKHFVGGFDARMVRIYRMIGSSPEVLGAQGEGRGKISVGLWAFDAAAERRVAERAAITAAQSQGWFNHAFGKTPALPFAKTG